MENLKLFFSFLFILLSLTACNLPSPKDKDEDTELATFIVDRFSGHATPEILDSNFSIPISKLYMYKACLRGHKQNKSLSGQKFEIKELNEEVTADNEGCLHWSEKIEYNFLSQSKFIVYTRTLQARGLQKGQRKIRFAINPWSHGESLTDAVDLSKEKMPDNVLASNETEINSLLKGHNPQNKGFLRSLWIDTARFMAQEDRLKANNQISIIYTFHSLPQIQMTKLNGDKYLYDLTKGKFRAKFQIIHSILQNGKEVKAVLPGAEVIIPEVEIKNRNLALKAPMTFTPPKWGHIYLAIELDPINGPNGLKKFDGIFYLGDYRATASNGFLKVNEVVSESDEFTIQSFVTDTKPTVHSSSATGQSEVLGAGVFIDKLRVTEQITDNAQFTKRDITYTVEACLMSNLNREPIRGLPFKVTTTTKDNKKLFEDPALKTVGDGCLRWTEKISYDHYQCQAYKKVTLRIENPDVGMNDERIYYINPWGSPTTSIDALSVDRPDILTERCNPEKGKPKIPVYIYIQSADLKLQSINQGSGARVPPLMRALNSKLHIVSSRKFLLNVTGRVSNYSDMKGTTSGSLPLPDGPYWLRMVVVSNLNFLNELQPNQELSEEHFKYVTSVEKALTAKNGQVAVEIDISFFDPFDIGNDNSVFIELIPLKLSSVEVNKDGVQLKSNLADATDPQLASLVVPFSGVFNFDGKKDSIDSKPFQENEINAYLLGQPSTFKKIDLAKVIQIGKIQQEHRAMEFYKLGTIEKFANSLNAKILKPLYPKAEQDAETQKFTQTMTTRISSIRANDKNSDAYTDIAQINTLIKWLFNAKDAHFSSKDSRNICYYWIRQIISSVIQQKDLYDLTRFCIFDPQRFFDRKKIYLVNDSASQFINGYETNVEIAHGLHYSKSINSSFTQSSTVGAGVMSLFKNVFGFDAGMRVSWATDESEGQGNAVHFNQLVKLKNHHFNYKTQLKSYQQCSYLKMNPNIFENPTKEKYQPGPNAILGWFSRLTLPSRYIKEDLTLSEIINTLSKGIIICDPRTHQTPITKIETVHMTSLYNSNGEQMQYGDPRNRFFVMIRGLDFFNQFVESLKNIGQLPKDYTYAGQNFNEFAEKILPFLHPRTSTPPGIYMETISAPKKQ